MAKGIPTIAVTSTLAMVRTASARGVEVADVLREAGLTNETLEDPDARLPAPTVMTVWNALRERTGDPVLQLVAPAAVPWGAYRIIDYLVAASATVGDGVRRFAQFFGLIADSLVLDIKEGPDDRTVQLSTVDGGPVPPVYVDYVFAALVTRIRMRIRPSLEVRRVELRLPEPKDTAPYREVFRAPITFGARADRLWFSLAEWKSPTVSGDAALADLLEAHARILSQRTPRAPAGFEEDVRRAITSTLSRGASVQQVARALNLSVRSLQRRLDECDTTFRAIAEDVRGQLAEGYLANPGVSISEVAVLLGFSEQSAFNRAFRRWTGESPGRWRRSPARSPRDTLSSTTD
jgi:AraC-like DNA-binding protein